MNVTRLAQQGTNTRCVDCQARPLFGGMRCLDCFHVRVKDKQGTHVSDQPPSYSSYQGGCRCRECRRASADYSKARRVKAAAWNS